MNMGLNVRGSIPKLNNIELRMNPKNINTERLTPIDDINMMKGSLFKFIILTKKYPGKIVKKMMVKACLIMGIS
jgi:hypothetical protein